MNAGRIVLFTLASAFFLTSSVYAGGVGSREAAAQRPDLEAISIANLGALGALYLLLDVEGENAEAGHRFQQRFATIQRSVADYDTLISRGGLVDDVGSSVFDWFPPEKRVALGRKLVALTETGSIEKDTFFELITLGAYLVITDGQAQDVAETSRRIADHASDSEYDPGPLLQDLENSVAEVDPDQINSSKKIKRIFSFFFCLLDCLGPLDEDQTEDELITWLDHKVLAYLCHSRGVSDACAEKKDQLNEWAEEAAFPRCPTLPSYNKEINR